jgi:hypothetical protein
VTAHELWLRLAALHGYVRDRDARSALEREGRLSEVLIGELLGPGIRTGRPRNGDKSSNLDDLSNAERHRFRTLAENWELVEQLLDQGVIKRKAILDAIAASVGTESTSGTVLKESYGAFVVDPPWDYSSGAREIMSRCDAVKAEVRIRTLLRTQRLRSLYLHLCYHVVTW